MGKKISSLISPQAMMCAFMVVIWFFPLNARHVVVNLTGSFHGFGDVVGSFAIAVNLKSHFKSDDISVIYDERAKQLLEISQGRTLASLEHDFDLKLVNKNIAKTMPKSDLTFEPFYGGRIIHDLTKVAFNKSDTPVVMIDTMHGTTFDEVRWKQHSLFFKPPGIGPDRSGVATDSSIAQFINIKDKNIIQRQFNNNQYLKEIIKNVGTKNISFIYGAHNETDDLLGQTEKFTQLLKEHHAHDNPVFVFSPNSIEELRRVLPGSENIYSVEQFSKRVDFKNEIYLISTGKINAAQFNALVALSNMPILMEGDNSIVTALKLKKAFLVYRSPWNGPTLQDLIHFEKQIGLPKLFGKIYNFKESKLPEFKYFFDKSMLSQDIFFSKLSLSTGDLTKKLSVVIEFFEKYKNLLINERDNKNLASNILDLSKDAGMAAKDYVFEYSIVFDAVKHKILPITLLTQKQTEFTERNISWQDIEKKLIPNVARHSQKIEELEAEVLAMDLQEEFGATIEGDTLKTFDGKIFKKILWQTPFHRKLRIELRDLEIEDVILKVFFDVFKNYHTYSQQEKDTIADWIIANAKFLGQEGNSQTDDFILKDSRIDNLEDTIKEQIRKYYSAVNKEIRIKFRRVANPDPVLAILTVSGGGGHWVVMEAIRSLIEPLKLYNVKIIDEVAFEEKSDPIYIVSGGKWSFEKIYSTIYQQQRDEEKANLLWRINSNLLTDYIPNDLFGEMRRATLAINPTLILNTIHHRPEYISISYYHNIPQLNISTDYDIPPQNTEAVQKASSDFVRFLLPAQHYSIFDKTKERIEQHAYRNERGGLITDYVNQKLDDIGFVNKFGDVFKVQGIPARLSFDPKLFNQQKLENIRRKYNISNGFHPVTVMFGMQGGEMGLEIADFLNDNIEKLKFPIHLISVAGKNKSLFNKFKDFKTKDPTKFQLTSLRLASEQEMSEIFAISKMLLGKPGGLATTECYYMSLPLVALDYHPWELLNLNFLKIFDLGHLVPEWRRDIITKINQIVETNLVKIIKASPVDWKGNFIRNMNEMLQLWGFKPITNF